MLGERVNSSKDKVSMMGTKITDYAQQLHDEIDMTPEEYQPLLWRIVHSFREGVVEGNSRDEWFTNSVQEGIRASKDGRLRDHSQVKAKWEARRASQMD